MYLFTFARHLLSKSHLATCAKQDEISAERRHFERNYLQYTGFVPQFSPTFPSLMSTMEEEVDTGQPVHWTVVHNAQSGDDQVEVVNDQAPLLVAMQPGVDVPAVEIGEVVVVTEGTEVVESQGGGTDGGNANYMQVATVEEVVEAAPYGRGNVIEVGAFQEGDIARCVAAAESRVKAARPKGRVAVAKAPPPSSSSESESEDSSDQSDNGSGLRKKPKKREFAHRYIRRCGCKTNL